VGARSDGETNPTNAKSCEPEGPQDLTTRLFQTRAAASSAHRFIDGAASVQALSLAVALGRLAGRSPVPVDLSVTGERVAPAAEEAIAFTVFEALTNVARHAHAARVTVDVDVVAGLLVADVTDDGVGGAQPRAGSGLQNAADRVEALGGSLSVESPRGIGTTVGAYVPLTPTQRSD
jgi:signal transduction histidine kinase